MAKELRFDVSALDKASSTFTRMASAVERFERRLEKLDGKRVEAEIGVDTDKADREVGRFATDTRRKLQAALSNLPELELDADSTDLDRKLVDVRRRMAELADKTIGVDLSAEEAIAEAQLLQRELDELARTSPDIRVRTDAAAAAVELQKINAEAEKLDGKTATVKVKTDKSLSDATIDIALLGRSLAALSIPAGIVAGAPAIASLGQSAKQASGLLLLIPAAATAAGLAVATLKIGFQGFGDAIGDDPKKAAEAMAKMAPAAREAATAVQGLRPAWDALRLDVQAQLFEGLGDDITKVGGTYLPLLQDSLSRVAEGFNFGAGQVAQFLQQASTVDSVRVMFGNLDSTLENLTGKTLEPLTSAFLDMGTVGSEILLELSDGAERGAASFATFIGQARQSGQLKVWMQQGVDVLRQLGQVAGNTGSILSSIFTAAGASGTSFLTTMVDVTGRVREFLSSAQGQSALVTTFESIRSVTAALAPGIQAVGRAIAEIVVSREASGALEAIATAFSNLVVAAAPVIVTISGMVSRAITPLATALGVLAPAIGPVVGALLAMKAASSAFSFVTAITGVTALRAAATGAVGSLSTLRSGAATTAAAVTTTGTAASGAGAAMRAAASGAVVVGTATSDAGNKASGAGGKLDGLKSKMSGLRASAGGLASALPLVGVALTALVSGAQAGRASLTEMDAAVAAGGPTLDAFRQKLTEQGDGLQDSTNWFGQATNAVDQWIDENISGIPTLNQLDRAIAEQNRRLDEQAKAAGVAGATFKSMRADTDAANASSGRFSDTVRLIGPALAGIKDGVAPTEEMKAAMDSASMAAGDFAQQSGTAAQRLGGVDAGAKAAATAMSQCREDFISAAVAAGMTEQAAGQLADKIGLIPKDAETNFRTNAATVALEFDQVNQKIREVPPGKTVTVNAMTEASKAQLEALGFTVKTLPDGRVEVTADTEAAKGQLELLASAARRPENKNINLNTLDAHTKARVLNDEASKPENKTVSVNMGNALPALQGLGAEARKPETKQLNLDTLDAHTKARVLADQARTPVVKPMGGDNTGGLSANELLTGAVQTPANKPVGADTSGGTAAVAGLQGTATAPATKPIGGDNSGGLSANELLNGAVGTGATKPIDGNNAGGMGANAALNGAVGTTATKPMAGNPAGANAANAGVVSAVQAPATKPVNANDSGARGVVSAFVGWVAGLVATVSVVANKIGFAGGGILPMADGGIVSPAPRRIVPLAAGDVGDPNTFAGHTLNPMPANQGKIVGANTWRVIGDRPSGDELFLPLVKSSAVSQALLEAGAARMGRQLVPKGMSLQPGPGVQVAPMAEGGMVTAARAIVARMNARGQMYEDLTWKGAPAVVGQHNDQLLDARDRAGYGRDTKRFLEDYIRRNTAAATPAPAAVPSAAAVKAQVQAAQAAKAAAPAVTVQTGLDVAQLKAIHAQLIGLRSDVLASGAWGPQLAENLRGWTNRVLSQIPATQRAALQRDLADIGPWG